MTKIVLKLSKRVLNKFWGNFSEKKFLPSVPWMVESSKCFQKIKNFSKFHNCTKSFPKVSKRVLNMFWGNFSEKFFCPVFHGRSSLRNVFKKLKVFKIPKMPKIVPKLSKGVLNMFWGTFSKTFLPSLPLRVESSKSFCTKFKIFSKFQKRAKSFLNCLKVFRTSFGVPFSKKFFLPSVPWRVESSKYFQKIKNFQISKKPKIVPKSVQTCFEHVLR